MKRGIQAMSTQTIAVILGFWAQIGVPSYAAELYVSPEGHDAGPGTVDAPFRTLAKAAGIAKAGACHLFRHTTARLMLQGGADIRYIQAILGHDSLATTQIYTHVSIGQLCAVHARTHPARLSRTPTDPSQVLADAPPNTPRADAPENRQELDPDTDAPDLPWVPTA